jgi:hypothetical protein
MGAAVDHATFAASPARHFSPASSKSTPAIQTCSLAVVLSRAPPRAYLRESHRPFVASKSRVSHHWREENVSFSVAHFYLTWAACFETFFLFSFTYCFGLGMVVAYTDVGTYVINCKGSPWSLWNLNFLLFSGKGGKGLGMLEIAYSCIRDDCASENYRGPARSASFCT